MVPRLLTRRYTVKRSDSPFPCALSKSRKLFLTSIPDWLELVSSLWYGCWDLRRKGPTELLFKRHIEDWPFAWCVFGTRQVIEILCQAAKQTAHQEQETSIKLEDCFKAWVTAAGFAIHHDLDPSGIRIYLSDVSTFYIPFFSVSV